MPIPAVREHLIQELHLWNLHSLPLGTCLVANRRSAHSVGVLKLRHSHCHTAELVTAWSQGRPNRRAAPGNAASPAPPPCPHHPGTTLGLPEAALDRCNNDRPIPLYGLGSPRAAWVTLPRREATLDGPALRATAPLGVSPIIGPTRCPCRPLAGTKLHQPCLPQGSGHDWLLSPRAHDNRRLEPKWPRSVVVVVVFDTAECVCMYTPHNANVQAKLLPTMQT